MKNNYICLICFKPNDVWINFLKAFSEHYKIYLIIDDNSIDYKEKYKEHSNLNCITVLNDDCEKNGYVNVNFMVKKGGISGWNKAIYYFSNIDTSYENIWFFEEDSFFYNEDTLKNIDSKDATADLLSKTLIENTTGERETWHWKSIDIKFEPPYYECLCCSIRVSKKLMLKIKEYVKENKTLFFLEALFPTICMHNKLISKTYDNFKEINYYWKDYTNIVDKDGLYHPVKDINNHILFRDIISGKVKRGGRRKGSKKTLRKKTRGI